MQRLSSGLRVNSRQGRRRRPGDRRPHERAGARHERRDPQRQRRHLAGADRRRRAGQGDRRAAAHARAGGAGAQRLQRHSRPRQSSTPNTSSCPREITRIAAQTKFNGIAIVGAGAGAQTFQVGANNGDTRSTSSRRHDRPTRRSPTVDRRDHRRTADATAIATVIAAIDAALDTITTNRATYGAAMSRFELAISNLQITGREPGGRPRPHHGCRLRGRDREPVARADPAAGRHRDGGAGQPAAAARAAPAARLIARSERPLKFGANAPIDRDARRPAPRHPVSVSGRLAAAERSITMTTSISTIGIGQFRRHRQRPGRQLDHHQLMAVERQPLTSLQTAGDLDPDARSRTYGKIKSGVSTLRDAAATLRAASTWNADHRHLVRRDARSA